MTGELSSILDHIEKISELDLDDVEPTSHVVALKNVLRADEPRPSLPRQRALAEAPDTDGVGFRVPSPGTWARELLELRSRADGRPRARGRG